LTGMAAATKKQAWKGGPAVRGPIEPRSKTMGPAGKGGNINRGSEEGLKNIVRKGYQENKRPG